MKNSPDLEFELLQSHIALATVTLNLSLPHLISYCLLLLPLIYTDLYCAICTQSKSGDLDGKRALFIMTSGILPLPDC